MDKKENPSMTDDAAPQRSSPRKDKDRARLAREFFEKEARLWENMYEYDREDVFLYKKQVFDRKKAALELMDSCSPRGGSLVLDIGCGPGVFIEDCRERGQKVVCMDIAGEMLRICQGKLGKEQGKRGFAIQGSAEEIPVAEGSFDFVIGLGLMEYLSDEAGSLDQIRSILKPDGFAIISFPNMLKMKNLLDPYYYFVRVPGLLLKRIFKKSKRLAEKKPGDISFLKNEELVNKRYKWKDIKNIIEKSHFQIERRIPVGYDPPTFWRKKFFSFKKACAWSERIDKVSKCRGFSWLQNFPNRYVILLKGREN